MKLTQCLALTGCMVLSAGVRAQVPDKSLMECAAIGNNIERLACYDSVAETGGLTTRTIDTSAVGKGKWVTSTKTDPLTDKSIHVARLEADSGRGRFGEEIAMFVRCQDNATEWYIDWNSFLDMEAIRITHRIGKDKAQTRAWTVSTDHKASFYQGSPIAVLRQMSKASSFVANVTPYGESPVTASFDTTGAEAALADIRKDCGWK